MKILKTTSGAIGGDANQPETAPAFAVRQPSQSTRDGMFKQEGGRRLYNRFCEAPTLQLPPLSQAEIDYDGPTLNRTFMYGLYLPVMRGSPSAVS